MLHLERRVLHVGDSQLFDDVFLFFLQVSRQVETVLLQFIATCLMYSTVTSQDRPTRQLQRHFSFYDRPSPSPRTEHTVDRSNHLLCGQAGSKATSRIRLLVSITRLIYRADESQSVLDRFQLRLQLLLLLHAQSQRSEQEILLLPPLHAVLRVESADEGSDSTRLKVTQLLFPVRYYAPLATTQLDQRPRHLDENALQILQGVQVPGGKTVVDDWPAKVISA